MRKLFVLLIALLITFSCKAQTYEYVYRFLRFETSPRAAAQAGSYVSSDDDPSVVFYNPAGIGNSEKIQKGMTTFSYSKNLEDVGVGSFSYVNDLMQDYRFSVNVTYLNGGTFTGKDEYNNNTGDFSAGDLAFAFTVASTLESDFYYGVTTKYIYSKLADEHSSGIAWDLGLNYCMPEQDVNIGFSVLNLGTQISRYTSSSPYEKLPLDIKFGVSKKLTGVPLKLALNFHRLNEGDNVTDRLKAFTVGSELTLSKVFKLRFGYDNTKREDFKLNQSAGMAGFNAGLGLTIKKFQFDYAYSSFGQVGSLHRIGITTKL